MLLFCIFLWRFQQLNFAPSCQYSKWCRVSVQGQFMGVIWRAGPSCSPVLCTVSGYSISLHAGQTLYARTGATPCISAIEQVRPHHLACKTPHRSRNLAGVKELIAVAPRTAPINTVTSLLPNFQSCGEPYLPDDMKP